MGRIGRMDAIRDPDVVREKVSCIGRVGTALIGRRFDRASALRKSTRASTDQCHGEGDRQPPARDHATRTFMLSRASPNRLAVH